jgi:hypothetical protein
MERKHAPHNFIQCSECRHQRHDPSSKCPYHLWYTTGKDRVEWKDRRLTRRRQGLTTESNTAASMRLWPSIRHLYTTGEVTAPTAASSSATGAPAETETDVYPDSVVIICPLLYLANTASTVPPSSPNGMYGENETHAVTACVLIMFLSAVMLRTGTVELVFWTVVLY